MEFMKLAEFTRKLYRVTGKMNLYISLCCRKNKPDIVRLKEEIEYIKQIILNIENEIDNLYKDDSYCVSYNFSAFCNVSILSSNIIALM